MRTRRLVKFFHWNEETRDLVTLGANTRIDPDRGVAELLATDGRFPTDANLFVRSRVTNPSTVRQWIGFQATIHHVEVDGAQVTDAGFRLFDGTDEFWWDGADWAEPTANDWNTEAEIANNISTFPGLQLAVVVNLVTTDARFSPQLAEVKVAWVSNIEFQEDLIYRSFIRLLRNEIRPIARAELTVPTGGASTFTLAQLRLETGYRVTGIDSVFNLTADPDMREDLFQSFDVGTGITTLSAAQPQAEILRVNFIYAPDIAVKAHQEGVVEIQRVPVILIRDIDLVGASQRQGEDSVVNKDTGEAIVVPAPLQGDLQFTLRSITEKDVDNLRLSDQLKRLFARVHVLKSTGLDEFYRLWLVDEFTAVGDASGDGLYEQEATVRIVGACFWLDDDYDDTATSRFVMRFGGEENPVTVE